MGKIRTRHMVGETLITTPLLCGGKAYKEEEKGGGGVPEIVRTCLGTTKNRPCWSGQLNFSKLHFQNFFPITSGSTGCARPNFLVKRRWGVGGGRRFPRRGAGYQLLIRVSPLTKTYY